MLQCLLQLVKNIVNYQVDSGQYNQLLEKRFSYASFRYLFSYKSEMTPPIRTLVPQRILILVAGLDF